jgi:hypothetical protein
VFKRVGRVLVASAVVSGVVAGMSACGSSGNSAPAPAVVVSGRTISQAAVEHWTPIEAILAYDAVFPTAPVPKGLVPDPPNYTNCVAYERRGNTVARSTLKRDCRERYEFVRMHILDYLITYQWLEKEVAERGLKVTDAEARQDLQRHVRSQFGNQRGFEKYLQYTGLTMADELLRFKNNLLANAVLQHVIQAPGTTLSQRSAAYTRFEKKWVARTHCRAGFIVPNCREYKGPRTQEPSHAAMAHGDLCFGRDRRIERKRGSGALRAFW